MDEKDFQTLVLERIGDLKSDMQDFKADVSGGSLRKPEVTSANSRQT